MKGDICLLDHHQKSHWNTITIGLKGMINWVLELNNSQLRNSFNSLLEKHHNQSKPNPIFDRSVKPENLSEDIRVKHAHDGTGQLVEQSSSSAHTVPEQFVPEENRDTASFNADNVFNRAIDKGYHILLWNDHMTSTFKTWFRRSWTTLNEKHFKVIFNNIDHSTLCEKAHVKMWWMSV